MIRRLLPVVLVAALCLGLPAWAEEEEGTCDEPKKNDLCSSLCTPDKVKCEKCCKKQYDDATDKPGCKARCKELQQKEYEACKLRCAIDINPGDAGPPTTLNVEVT